MGEETNGLSTQIYMDLAQPATREAGEVVRRAVRLALAPARGTLWTLEQAEEYVAEGLQKMFSPEDAETLTPAPARIFGPVLSGVAQVGDDQLRNLYVQLLASSMKPREQDLAHPAFAEIIRQLVPSEARILNVVSSARIIPTLQVLLKRGGEQAGVWVRHVSVIGLQANADDPSKTDLHLENLVRLRLLEELDPLSHWGDDSYELIYQLADLERLNAYARKQKATIEIRKSGFRFTDLGRRFADVCLPKGYCVPQDVADHLDKRVVGHIDRLEEIYRPL